MTMYVLQSILLLSIAFVLGCIFGAIARHFYSRPKIEPSQAEIESVAEPAEKPPQIDPVPETSSLSEVEEIEVNISPQEPVVPAPVHVAVEKIDEKRDDLKKIKGIGPQNESRLNAIGITTYAQIAAWTAEEQHEIGERLAFPGRIERENWVSQAVYLVRGTEEKPPAGGNREQEKDSIVEAKPKISGDVPALFSEPPEMGGDNLTLIEGIGNALENKMNKLGIYTFDQIANWSDGHQSWVGEELGFPGRPAREGWVNSAKLLADDNVNDRSRKVERGEITASRKARL